MYTSRRGSRRIAMQRMVNSAHTLNLDVMQGKLVKSAETGRWQIGPHDLLAWLEAHVGEDIMTVIGTLDGVNAAEASHEPELHTCRKCGRDYTDLECPHCRNNRRRIRGR